ncbi:Calmodulin [Spraguea lophii 42_110]|uniref:Calmodulin n=1 Tax=Spraguea lophii (strain 42_110) TaxID=1358809 RepID=S7WB78_SPRLO|nr:Calmodulin [Spraguea lophii 42_110]
MTSSEKELKIFRLFTKGHNDYVEKKNLADMLRHLGHTVTNNDVEKILSEIEGDKLSFSDFQKISKDMVKNNISKEDIKKAFKTFDPENTGFIDIKVLKDILIGGVEKFTEEELEEVVNILGPNAEGMINYDNFIKKCY